MEQVFAQYESYKTLNVVLELVAIAFSVASVLCSLRNHVAVFPLGIVSTGIFVYLLFQWNLLGDMVINGYYLYMSVYGWYIWTRKVSPQTETPITSTSFKEWGIGTGIFAAAVLGIFILYYFTDRLEATVSYIDMVTTGIFFTGMWLMAKRKLEHWLVLMLGNIISVPLYFYKGYAFSALLYIFLSIIALIGYLKWRKYQHNQKMAYS